MCTYNGDRFLIEQLASFERQTHHNWTLIVSDDGSQDETLKILQTYSSNRGANRLKVVSGPKRGFVANFLSLTSRRDIQANFYAWSDQDDIWREDKLQKALDWLQTIPEQTPALYCGRTELICEAGTTIGLSPKFSRPPHFSNALVQSIGGGNTMVFNQAARALLQEAGDNLMVPSHDWWAYQLISGAGGIIHYDTEPKVLYRQHNGNLVGSNSNWPARLRRLNMVFKGRYYEWNVQNICALETMQHRLSQEHKESLTNFKKARNQNIFGRLLGIWQTGLYRQTLFGNLGLIIATLFKKI
ncbi:glycosyltransferase family 2 protein [Pseudomonas protegens]|uniref:glycosyltransferase family 2 protein n=1 Tax=Pseudomonas protegens TaxID=380021 RepID=UPI00384B9F04